MKKQFRRKYRKARVEFKHELKEICKKDKTLQWLIYEEYRTEGSRNHIFDVYTWLSKKSPRLWKEFCETSIWMDFPMGECGIWSAISRAYPEFTEKYIEKIPQKCAMGDALAVVYRLDFEEREIIKHENKQ